jgi:hypothetical protein
MSQRLNYEFSSAILCYTWRCDICGATKEQTWKVNRGDTVPLAGLPEGWRKYWKSNHPHYAYYCCPRHGIQLLIDGVEVWSEKPPILVEVEVR